ncbi:hypothetical protein ACTAZI_03290 [Legionella bozemanae]|uniref:hypothetical protein n=1 Tax=Legionella bozemanae TaxID=447 RepID=UPI003EF08798
MRTPTTIRSAAMKYYQTAKIKLDDSEIDSNEVKEAIEDFNNAINKVMELQEIAEVKGLSSEYYFTAEDYKLLSLASIGIARSYDKVTKGVQRGDIDYRLEMATRYLELATKNQTTQNKQESPHVALSMLKTFQSNSLVHDELDSSIKNEFK